jgi:hypothetical protein
MHAHAEDLWPSMMLSWLLASLERIPGVCHAGMHLPSARFWHLAQTARAC